MSQEILQILPPLAGGVFFLILVSVLFWMKSRRAKGLRLGEDWLPHRPGPLTLQLPELVLNRVKLGDSYEALKTFGRPDNANPLSQERFDYKSSGLQISLQNERSQEFHFLFDREQDSGKPCRLKLIQNSEEQSLSHSTRTGDIADFLRRKGEEEQWDDGFTLSQYELAGHQLDFFFDDSGNLHALEISRSSLD